MNDDRLYQLIHRELTQQLSAEELKEISQLKEKPEFGRVYSQLTTVWNISDEYFPSQTFDVQSAKKKFKERIATESKPATDTFSKPWLIGALITLIALTILIATYFSRVENAPTPNTEIINELEYALLPDNSQIWTNENSSLSYQWNDNASDRIVTLQGEAYFDISDDPSRSFVIEMGQGDVLEVVGTAFNLAANPETREHEVYVNRGKVRMYNKANPDLGIEVLEGQYGLFNAAAGTIFTENMKESYSFFAEELKFRNTPLPVVLEKVGKFFNIKFDYDQQSIENCLVSSPLMDDFGLYEIFEVLQGIYPVLEFEKITEHQYEVSGVCEGIKID